MPDNRTHDDDLSAEARAMLETEIPMEEVLAALRRRGATVMQTITVIRGLTGISLREAKDLIHNSRAWSDVGRELATSHERLLDAIDETGERVSVDGREYLRVRLPESSE